MKLLLLSTVLFITGCATGVVSTDSSSQHTVPEWHWAEYYITQCNNTPWQADGTGETVIEYYAEQYGIAIQAVEFLEPTDLATTCSACGCPSGEVVRVQVSLEDRKKLLDLGFHTEGDDIEFPSDTVKSEVVEDTIEEVSSSPELEEDAKLADVVANVQVALELYYANNGYYPDAMHELEMEAYDLSRVTYTPIGTTPASYYDLTVEYTTGKVTLNP